jgi:hypothetical protein
MKIVMGATGVSPDEPCLGLYEYEFKTPDQKERHRYQIIMVIRDDKPSEHRIDLGNVKKFKNVDQFRIPGGVVIDGKAYIEETVGRLQGIADQLRKAPCFDKMELAMSGVARKQSNKILIT